MVAVVSEWEHSGADNFWWEPQSMLGPIAPLLPPGSEDSVSPTLCRKLRVRTLCCQAQIVTQPFLSAQKLSNCPYVPGWDHEDGCSPAEF